MKQPYGLKHMYPFIDVALLLEPTLHTSYKDVYSKILWLSSNPREAVAKLAQAKILFLHPDGFDKWTDILLELQQQHPLPVKLIIIADSDYTLGHEHMDTLLAFFPETQFWIQNWYGSHERVKLLPIGVNGHWTATRERTRPIGISFLLQYIGNVHRDEFFRFLNENPSIQRYCLPKTGFQDYCDLLSECYFSTCPMGEGYDTFRFWESLMMGAIPIVKEHPFYEVLRLHYPKLPFLVVKDWKDLIDLIPTMNQEWYERLWKEADLSCLEVETWIRELPDSCLNPCGK
jgi:hypothetical protein